jgi:glycosyltransferase involved in cell wall biosynthesis
MKIAIDLRPLQIGHQDRGIGAYLLNLLEYLPEDANISYLFLRYDVSEPLVDFEIDVPVQHEEVVFKKHVVSKHPTRLIRYLASNFTPGYQKVLRHKPDVFFQVDYLLGAPKSRHCQVVAVAHDLIPFKFKQIYLPSHKKYFGFRQLSYVVRARLIFRAWFYEKKYKKGVALLKRASKIISVSSNTRNDLESILGIEKQRVTTIYSAASFRSSEEDLVIREEIKQTIDKLEEPFITYVGGTDLRRQIDELVYAYNLYNARHQKINLVLCGNEFEKNCKEINQSAKRAIDTSSYSDGIFALGKVTEAEKEYIMSKTAAFVYPTLYEGFGLPLLEAMQCGAPLISYKNSSIPEIAGDAALYTKGTGAYPIFAALENIFSNPSDTKKRTALGIKNSRRFRWDTCASKTWDLVVAASK